jgi:hypothetical protein
MAKRRPQAIAHDTSSSLATPKPKPKARRPPAETRRSLEMAPAPMPPAPTEEDIRHRAYLRYLERGASEGDAFDDWLFAERELKKN